MLAVVAHDAGGAEILSSYICQQALVCSYVLDGPAVSIFERKLGPIKRCDLADALNKSERILCGTSWQSDLEFDAIKRARALGKHSIAFLDHWTNYKERFIRMGELCLPDEIWVGDNLAEQMARDIFPSLPLKLIENPYFDEIRRAVNGALTKLKSGNILYVCEPIREHALKQYGDERYWGYTEEDALRYFLSHMNDLDLSVEQILIRLHPSEMAGKYDWVLNEFDLPLRIESSTLLEAVAACDMVVGCQSMAMVVGLLAGKKVMSVIPPQGAACVLPQKEILHLQELIKERDETN